jgi:hypothetical protein
VVADAVPVRHGVPADDVLFDLVGDAHVVLIGEASHGTREFYAAGGDDPAADREEGVSARSRSRPTGPMRTG